MKVSRKEYVEDLLREFPLMSPGLQKYLLSPEFLADRTTATTMPQDRK